jgi:hypothetical protein
MTNICPAPVANAVPAGWAAPRVRFAPSMQSLESPDGTSTFVSSFRTSGPDRFDAFERDAIPHGTVLVDRREPCGSSTTVRRVDVQIGGQISEIAVALVHGTAYKYVYTRPVGHDVDAGADRALTAFCRAVLLPAAGSSPG